MRSDLKLDSFTLETLKNHLIRNFLRNGRVRVKNLNLRSKMATNICKRQLVPLVSSIYNLDKITIFLLKMRFKTASPCHLGMHLTLRLNIFKYIFVRFWTWIILFTTWHEWNGFKAQIFINRNLDFLRQIEALLNFFKKLSKIFDLSSGVSKKYKYCRKFITGGKDFFLWTRNFSP